MRKVFNRYVLAVVLGVLLLATGVKVHASLAAPLPRDRNHRNLARIDRASREFSFAVFGDNQNNREVFDGLVERLNREDIDFALANGDTVFDGQTEKYRAFLDQADRLEKPLVTAIGNHEAYSNGRGLYHDAFGPFDYSFRVGDSFFIVFDNTLEGGPGPGQMAWLRSELEKSEGFEHLFVFMHVPLYDTRETGFGLEHGMKSRAAARRLNRLLDRYDVTMLFTSHIHQYDRGTWGKTPYIITGGAGGELAGTDPDHNFFHFIRVDVSPGGAAFEVVRLNTPSANILRRLVHGTWMHAYCFMVGSYFFLLVLAGFYVIVFALYHRERGWGGRHSKESGSAEEDPDEEG